MPKTIYTGKDVKITFGTITARFQSIRIRVTSNKFEATPSDSTTVRRGTGTQDASITITGFDSDDAGAAGFDDVATLVLTKAAPTALSWTDTAGTPVSKLPANFFTTFPLAKWRVDSAEGGSAGPGDPSTWTVELTPNNDD